MVSPTSNPLRVPFTTGIAHIGSESEGKFPIPMVGPNLSCAIAQTD